VASEVVRSHRHMPPSRAPRGEKAARNSKEQTTAAAPPSAAPGAIGLGVLEIPNGPIPGFTPFETTETDASKCVLSGQGLHEATVRQATYFWIQAVDMDGKKKTSGGDIFFCAIRGPAAVRARVLDNADGTYLVVWKPSTSGQYSITISLFGISLPGVPFKANASTNQPCHTKCEVRGSALYQAISRSTHSFEIFFRDRLGQVAHAVDLDVFVEEVRPDSPRTRAGSINQKEVKAKEEEMKLKAKREAEAEEREASLNMKVAKKGEAKLAAKKSSKKEEQVMAAVAAKPAEVLITSAPVEARGEAGGFTSRKRTMRVRIEKTLVVRTEPAREAPEVGRLFAEQVVTILEERVVDDGVDVWGCVALDSIGQALDNVLKHAVVSENEADVSKTTPVRPRQQTAEWNREMARRAATPALARTPTATTMVTSLPPPPATPAEAAPSSGVAAASTTPSADASPVPPPPAAPGPHPSLTAGQSSARPSTRVDERALKGWVAGTHSWRPGYFSPAPSGPASRSSAEEVQARQQQQQQQLWESGQTAWVLLMTHGKKLVTSRVKLDPESRQQYLHRYIHRCENDKIEKVKSAEVVKDFRANRLSSANLRLELASDPAGIGFGFGGVEPGTLHAHGQLHEKHSVYYSIGLAGHYLLHVRLRHAAAAVPGSPFALQVLPAPAHASATRLPVSSVSGNVGLEEKVVAGQVIAVSAGSAGSAVEKAIGARVTLRTADKMGNYCIAGGADVKLVCEAKGPVTKVRDNKDGTYLLEWLSMASGTFKSRVTIGGDDVIGSPITFTLISSEPDLSKSVLEGAGLTACIAGIETEISIRFLDQYGNTALPGAKFAFGLAFTKNDKEGTNAARKSTNAELANIEPRPHKGQWEPGDTGVYRIRYSASEAGPCRLHIWCDPQSKGERLPFPNSPFQLAVSSGEASATVSQVDGWTKLIKDEKVKYGKGTQADANTLVAGDTLTIRPEIYDQLRNLTVVQEGQLVIRHDLPNGTHALLKYNQQVRGGTTLYDIKHDTAFSGQHEIHVMLGTTPIKGSPVTFAVLPDKPDPEKCKLLQPEDAILLVDRPYASVLRTYDKYGNACVVGGHKFGTRLQLMKQSVHDQTALVPQNHSIEVDDRQDGTYHISVTLAFSCNVKLFVNMDKNLPGAAGELPPVNLNFVKSESDVESNPGSHHDGVNPLDTRPNTAEQGHPLGAFHPSKQGHAEDADEPNPKGTTRSHPEKAISARGSKDTSKSGGESTRRSSSAPSPKVSAQGSKGSS